MSEHTMTAPVCAGGDPRPSSANSVVQCICVSLGIILWPNLILNSSSRDSHFSMQRMNEYPWAARSDALVTSKKRKRSSIDSCDNHAKLPKRCSAMYSVQLGRCYSSYHVANIMCARRHVRTRCTPERLGS